MNDTDTTKTATSNMPEGSYSWTFDHQRMRYASGPNLVADQLDYELLVDVGCIQPRNENGPS